MPLRNSKLYYILIVLLLGSSYTQAQQFVKVGGQASDIAISPKDGRVFVVAGKNIFTDYDNSAKRWKTFSTRPNNAKSVSVTKDGVVYITSTAGEVFIEVKGKWIKVPGVKTDEVIAAKDGRIYAIDTNKKLRLLNNAKWNLLSGQNRISNGLNQVIGIGSKELYARAGDNSYSKFSGGKWNTLNGKPNKIALDHKTGIIYAVGRNKGIYKWVFSSNEWVLLEGTRKDFKDVAVHKGIVWAITVNNTIYYCDTSKKAKDYTGTYEVSFLQLGAPKKGNKYYGGMGVYLNATIKSGKVPIGPLNGKKNRAWDISKEGPQVANKSGFSWIDSFESGSRRKTTASSLEIEGIRKFKLVGEAAKGYPEFDFQFNVKRYDGNLPGMRGVGQWERQKIKMDDLILGKVYYRYLISCDAVISFRVDKL
ncbi:MAG: tectonin domain-containing protein [Bacteroidota bacterium]